MKSKVEQLSWVESLYPSSIGERVAGGLDSLSGWLKSARSPKSSSNQDGHKQGQRGSSSQTRLEWTSCTCSGVLTFINVLILREILVYVKISFTI